MINIKLLTTVVVVFTLISTLDGLRLCLYRSHQSNGQDYIWKPQLRSYHPHYLHSFSYPQTVSPHFYYGQVINNKPILFYKNQSISNNKTDQIFIINNKQSDSSAKNQIISNKPAYRFMFILQIQNQLRNDISASIEVHRTSYFYLFFCQYNNKEKVFLLYLKDSHNQALKMYDQQSMMGIKLWLRQVSEQKFQDNWKLGYNLKWKGQSNVEIGDQGINVKGLVVQIEYHDSNLLDKVQIHIKEIPTETNEKKQNIINRIKLNDPLIDDGPITPPRNSNSCAETAVFKVIQGLSYEYGELQLRDGDNIIYNEPKPLLSFSPSRSKFPWGFLWDDGFHCEIIIRYQPKLALQVIQSWLETILDIGWIPREQNRGAQRSFLCSCPRFKTKDIRDGNPPTLILALAYLRRNNRLSSEVLPVKYWIKLKQWYHWFLQTQKSDDKYIFRWHDSIQGTGSFTSGLDDFPRPNHSKGHIDMQCWMYFFSQFMQNTAPIYQENDKEYEMVKKQILKNIKFFKNQNHIYIDFDKDGHFSKHIGYPSILPIAFGMLQYGTKQYNASITVIRQKLDTDFGLSSISKDDTLYLQNRDAYWRGPVWINMNYLFLRGLKMYYPLEVELYSKLRRDLLKVVCGNWKEHGYFYENYIKGKGSFSFPFNGWTSLISIIDNENY